jgi:hypothetical protein
MSPRKLKKFRYSIAVIVPGPAGYGRIVDILDPFVLFTVLHPHDFFNPCNQSVISCSVISWIGP